MTSRTYDRLGAALPWLVIVLLAVPVGGAVWVGFVDGDIPCILGWAQRTSMLLIALVGLFTIRFGLRTRYLGMGVLLATAGVFMSLRHATLHVARDVGQGFVPPPPATMAPTTRATAIRAPASWLAQP